MCHSIHQTGTVITHVPTRATDTRGGALWPREHVDDQQSCGLWFDSQISCPMFMPTRLNTTAIQSLSH